MNYISKIFTWILLLPLMAGVVLSQTAAGSGASCIHCLKVEVVKQDCCANMAGSMAERGGRGDRETPGECPHDGFCVQPVDGTPVSILFPNTPVELTIPAQISPILSNFVPAALQLSQFPSASPGNKEIHLFTLHCAYLI